MNKAMHYITIPNKEWFLINIAHAELRCQNDTVQGRLRDPHVRSAICLWDSTFSVGLVVAASICLNMMLIILINGYTWVTLNIIRAGEEAIMSIWRYRHNTCRIVIHTPQSASDSLHILGCWRCLMHPQEFNLIKIGVLV